MITKREKLQYIYVFLTDLVVLLLSTLLAWLVTDGLLKQLVPYAPSDWVQTICLLMLAFVATFICFDQTENIVTRTSGEEIKLSIKFNVLLALVYSTAMLLTKAEMLDSRYFTLAVPLINFVLLPIAHGLLKRSLLQIQSQSGLESLVGLISTQDRAELLINELQRDWSKRISGVAILEAPASEIGSTLAGVPVTANYDNFMDWIRQAALDEIYVDIPMDSGESFIAKYDPNAIAVLVLDVRMPGMSGLEVQEHLLARKADLPIIFITGHGDVPMAVRALKKGAVDFIEKPFQQAALKAQVEHMLNEARERRMKNERQSLNEALLAKLTPREQQVLERIVAGRLNKQIADDLGISIKTVEAHRASIMDKTNSGTVADLMRVVMDTSQPVKFLDGSQAAK